MTGAQQGGGATRSSSRDGSEASYDVVSNGTSGQEKGGDEEESDWE